jgi:hypothetical protein
MVQKNHKKEENRNIRFGTFHFGRGLSTMLYDTLDLDKIRAKKVKKSFQFFHWGNIEKF